MRSRQLYIYGLNTQVTGVRADMLTISLVGTELVYYMRAGILATLNPPPQRGSVAAPGARARSWVRGQRPGMSITISACRTFDGIGQSVYMVASF